MKKLVLISALVLLVMQTFAQELCKDIIYPEDNESIIFNCCIYEVKDNNVVYYVREGDSAFIAAVSIIKDGQEIKLDNSDYQITEHSQNTYNDVTPDGLYNGKDYDYYLRTYQGATTQRNAGIFMTLIGLGFEIGGFIMAADGNYDNDNAAGGLIIAGSILETIGIPLWISGGVKRANNKRVMEDMERGMNLSFGASHYGVGMVLKF